MQPDWVVKIEVPTTLTDEAGKPRHAVGTGYPLRDGLVITARHVLYPVDKNAHGEIVCILNQAGRRILSWRQGDKEPPYHKREIPQRETPPAKIVFENAEYDIALIEVETPHSTPAVIPCRNSPAAIDKWEAVGYPKGGKLVDGERKKTSAAGDFLTDTKDHIQHLKTGESVAGINVWKGMSGAPVFRQGTNELAGILTHGNPAFPERLMMVSLAWLLEQGRCPEFRDKVLGAPERLLPEEKRGDAFRDYLQQELFHELNRQDSDTQLFCRQLANRLDIGDAGADRVANTLVALPPVEAIDLLTVATADCVVPDGSYFREVKAVEELKKTAQQVLGWLVIASVDEQQLGNIIPRCEQHDSFFFRLGVKSLAGVEVVMARRFQRSSRFMQDSGFEQKSPHVVTPPSPGGLKWDEKESVRKLFVEVWNQVNPRKNDQKNKNYQPTDYDWSRLNTLLKKRRGYKRPLRPEHYYLPFCNDEYNKQALADYVEQVYHQFLSKLDQLTVVQYGISAADSCLFIIDEDELEIAVSEFYRHINGEAG